MDFREVREFLSDFGKYIIAIVIAILMFTYVMSFMQVVGPSMNSTLHEGQLIFISKLHYNFTDVKRGDIIVFENNGIKNMIKRIIGLPGDKIEFKDNKLYINDSIVNEDYLDENMITNDFNSCSLSECTVPENSYFVLGDNRLNSQDSRDLGYISKDKIIGKVVVRFWPLNKIKKF